LSPNEHRQHAEPDEHTGTPAMRAMATMPPSSGTGSGQPALTIPVIVYSEMVQEWLGFTPPQFPGSQWVG
jgi:hypothetical protein